MQPVTGFVRLLDGVLMQLRCGHKQTTPGVIVPKWVECRGCAK